MALLAALYMRSMARLSPLVPCIKMLRYLELVNLLNGIPRIHRGRCCTHAMLKYQVFVLLTFTVSPRTAHKAVKLPLEASYRVGEEGNVICKRQNGQDVICYAKSVNLWAVFHRRLTGAAYLSLSCCQHWANSSCLVRHRCCPDCVPVNACQAYVAYHEMLCLGIHEQAGFVLWLLLASKGACRLCEEKRDCLELFVLQAPAANEAPRTCDCQALSILLNLGHPLNVQSQKEPSSQYPSHSRQSSWPVGWVQTAREGPFRR